ncbi:ATP-grasp domain-containing protein [Scytonema millei]|uniref:ATP-grasp domain-containing protein n=1 Tax=Scytonema millei TaxID=1245922 RepID=UPI000AC7E775|nr:ATP-grasp domain-containing protein [Scytonema millei]
MAKLLSDERVELQTATAIDIGVIQGRGWAVVEQNAAWGAGLYECDPVEVLEVLRHTTY